MNPWINLPRQLMPRWFSKDADRIQVCDISPSVAGYRWTASMQKHGMTLQPMHTVRDQGLGVL
jgi:hypothetical protein